MRKFWTLLLAGCLCAGNLTAKESVMLNGAGATFPYPLYSKWFYTYGKNHSNVKINYQSIGSGGGIQQILKKTVDFGASDAPMDEGELKQAAEPLLHIPTVLGSVVLVYRLEGVPSGLKLTGKTVADIFLGRIKYWDDGAIAQLNPGVQLPHQAIFVVHRSDGSGTTYVFTDYLSRISPEWKQKAGTGKAVKWPAGLGGKGNEGVTGLVKQTPGSIGYVELAYAVQNKLPLAAVQNAAGEFVAPSIASITASADGVPIPADYRVSITNPPGKGAYPISAFTYLLLYRKQTDPKKGKALVNFLKWAMHEGQTLAPALHYAPLPAELVKRLDQTIANIQVSP